MQIILLEKIRNLGNLGDKVDVKSGYGRNYLLPQGKAVVANANNSAQFEKRRAELEKKADLLLNEAQQRANKLNELSVTIAALASDEGKLYGSVGANEITKAINAAGIEVLKREVTLPDGPLHAIGEYNIIVQVHSDVMAKVKIIVIASK